MPRTKFDVPKYPPIDWLMAAILERKKVMKLDWSDLADASKISVDSMKRLASTRPPEEWPADIRKSVCRKLGIGAKLMITDLHEVEM